MGEGPPIKVPDASGQACTGQIARRLFGRAICTCDDISFGGYMRTRSFSSSAMSDPIASGAAVGINDELWSGSWIDVGGTLEIEGNTQFASLVQAGGDLLLGSSAVIANAGVLTVGRDAWFEQQLTLLGLGFVTRDMHIKPGTFPPLAVVGGATVSNQSFDLQDPCACEPQDLLDIDAIVDAGATDNNNVEAGLDPASLTNLIGLHRVELPCGRFYLDSVGGIGGVTFVVNGRTALYIEGDVANLGVFDIELGPDGELDIFIKGNLLQIGYSPFGSLSRPSAVRVYVGGDGDIVFAGYQPFGANLYAPKSAVIAADWLRLRGSLFARDILAGGFIDVEYDRDILDLGNEDECNPDADPDPEPQPDAGVPPPPPPPECDDKCDATCQGNKTCVAGACGSCNTDADCCAPLVCYADGRCGPLLL